MTNLTAGAAPGNTIIITEAFLKYDFVVFQTDVNSVGVGAIRQ